MAINSVDLYTRRTMGRVIKRMPPVHTFFRDTFFTDRQLFDTETIDFDIVKGDQRLAPFVHPLIGGKPEYAQGFETKTYKPPLVSGKMVTTADQLLKRAPGQGIYERLSPAARALQRLGLDFEKIDRRITRREEWMCATTLFEGYIPVVGDGLNEVIDFDFENRVDVVNPTDKWDNAGSTPFDQLEDWFEQVQQSGYVNPNIAVCGRKVANALINHPKSKELLDIKNYELAVIKPKMRPNGITYIGTYHKLGLDIYQCNTFFLDDWTDPQTPKNMPLVPEGKIGLFSTDAIFSMLYAGIAMINPDTKEPEIWSDVRVPDSWVKKDPDRRFVSLSAKPLAVPHEVNSWLIAKVL